MLLITVYLLINGLPGIITIGPADFLRGHTWASTAAEPQFGILPFVLTTLCGTAGALLLGVPVGFFTAVYLARLAPRRLHILLESAVNLLAGIPSVVYGLVGMLVLGVRRIFGVPDGASPLAATPVLAVMILPNIIRVTITALDALPPPPRNTKKHPALLVPRRKKLSFVCWCRRPKAA